MSKTSKPDCVPDALIRALQNPACYSHAAHSIELIETHISWVLLAGEFAYKIKKPVKLPFVDFSTLTRRKYFCDEELRLNRRFAPQLYLSVVPIVGTPTAPHVGGSGDPIEYAVKLRRFHSSDELAHLLTGGVISLDELRQFGRDIAAIQSTLPVVSTDATDVLKQTTDDNCIELAQMIGASNIDNVCAFLRAQIEQLRDHLFRRADTDRVRECHGDLHTGNVVRADGKLLAFDCVEFDSNLRRIDVVHDIAFLVMDLQARDRSDLAYAFLNGWLEANGDFEGIALLPYSCAQRALIRAKVELLNGHVIDDEPVQRYLREAARRTRIQKPRLIITCGRSGSGKTWLANRCATELPAVHVRSDVERKRLAGLGALDSSRSSLDSGIYSQDFNARTYERLRICAQAALQASEHAIVDAAFLRRNERLAFISLAKECNADFAIFYCNASEDVLRDRISQRSAIGRDASEATLQVLANQQSYWEPFTDSELPFLHDIDTTRSVDFNKLF